MLFAMGLMACSGQLSCAINRYCFVNEELTKQHQSKRVQPEMMRLRTEGSGELQQGDPRERKAMVMAAVCFCCALFPVPANRLQWGWNGMGASGLK
jgi:hypothetical protein